MKYFEEAKSIWKTCVPRSGQSQTVEGELLRAVEKLRGEALRNGNGNWDRGFEILLVYLEEHLLSPDVYSPTVIEETRTSLVRLKNFDEPYLEDDLYNVLVDRVVEYFHHYGSQPHKNNQELYR